MASILCKYFVQNDPKEGEAGYPNLFVLSKHFTRDEPVQLTDVLADFPLRSDRRAHYHLRFETALPGAPGSTIWIDVLNEEAVVPQVAPGTVSIKVLKLPQNVTAKLKRPKRSRVEVPSVPAHAPVQFPIVNIMSDSPPSAKNVAPPLQPRKFVEEKSKPEDNSDGDFDVIRPAAEEGRKSKAKPNPQPQSNGTSKFDFTGFNLVSDPSPVGNGTHSEDKKSAGVPELVPTKASPVGSALSELIKMWPKKEETAKNGCATNGTAKRAPVSTMSTKQDPLSSAASLATTEKVEDLVPLAG